MKTTRLAANPYFDKIPIHEHNPTFEAMRKQLRNRNLHIC
jgi:hypothetical protein